MMSGRLAVRFAAVLVIAACGPARSPASPPAAAPAARPEKTVQLNAPGEPVDLAAALPAGYVTVVDFWSESCHACVELGGLLAVGVAKDPRIVIRKVDVGDGFTQVARAYQIEALPRFQIYDKRKRLRYDLVGSDCVDAVRHAVILAGGNGTRLWPASRRARPKQLLPLGPRGETLLEGAIRRGRAIAGPAVVVVTAESQLAATREVVPGVELLVEPLGRNTAAALGLAAAVLAERDRDAVLTVLPADQHVADEPGLARALEAVLATVERDEAIGTIGITPTRPETGFGYLEVDHATPGVVTAVRRFVEKPDAATAEAYLASGRYLWNAGMFCVSARRLLAELDHHLPATAHAVRDIAAGRARAADLYPNLAAVSIDHAVMERASGVVTVPAAVGWDDVGSWAALPALHGTDQASNTVTGAAVILDGGGNIAIGDDDALIAMVGVSDLIVVKSGNTVLVLPRAAAQDVRKIVDALSVRGLTRYL
jgi:mannose-1-phosphate guanylyltransferase